MENTTYISQIDRINAIIATLADLKDAALELKCDLAVQAYRAGELTPESDSDEELAETIEEPEMQIITPKDFHAALERANETMHYIAKKLRDQKQSETEETEEHDLRQPSETEELEDFRRYEWDSVKFRKRALQNVKRRYSETARIDISETKRIVDAYALEIRVHPERNSAREDIWTATWDRASDYFILTCVRGNIVERLHMRNTISDMYGDTYTQLISR